MRQEILHLYVYPVGTIVHQPGVGVVALWPGQPFHFEGNVTYQPWTAAA